ncbi:MAG: hypothetical protein WB729_05650 [Candidatus Sulfotelmatobacter sp.]
MNDWLPLSNYTAGVLRGRRSFTWWTASNLSLGPAILNGHRIGLPNNWIARYSVILRLDLTAQPSLGTVPTVIDGFDSIVFHSLEESSIPGMGKAIDLRHLDALRPGSSEFVINDVPIEQLSCIPVEIDETARDQYRVDLRDDYFLAKLAQFYAEQDTATP